MRVALTGASGFIGAEIARVLHERGDRVTALVRESSRRDHIEDAVDRFVVAPSHADPSAWDALLDGADAATVEAETGVALEDADCARLRELYAGQTKGELKLLGLNLQTYTPDALRVAAALGLLGGGFFLTRALGRE